MTSLDCVITTGVESDDLWAEVGTPEEWFAAVSLEPDGRFVLRVYQGIERSMLSVDLADFRDVVDRACRRLSELYPERRPGPTQRPNRAPESTRDSALPDRSTGG